MLNPFASLHYRFVTAIDDYRCSYVIPIYQVNRYRVTSLEKVHSVKYSCDMGPYLLTCESERARDGSCLLSRQRVKFWLKGFKITRIKI